MKIIHLVSDISRINFGVWNVVIATFPYLEETGHEPELWFPVPHKDFVIPEEIKKIKYRVIKRNDDGGWKMEGGRFGSGKNMEAINDLDYREHQSSIFNPPSSIFISHGTWGWATQFGYKMKKEGFKWIAVPHGMLEPWSMKQKRLKKKLYFKISEYPKLKKADAIIAVGRPEFDNLKKLFSNVHHIPNGIDPHPGPSIKRLNDSTIQPSFLFLGRLHHKKGVVPLTKAWLASSLFNDPGYQLIIAGPDEGELPALKVLLENRRLKMDDGTGNSIIVEHNSNELYRQNDPSSILHPLSSTSHPPSSNVLITGPVYGPEKEKLLSESHYFILPSQSEGFPTSILEAMTHGCIPVFTEECNFPEALEAGVGIAIRFDVEDIKNRLEEIKSWTEEKRNEMSEKAKQFADGNYNWKDIAKKQVRLYEIILNHRVKQRE